MSGRRSPKLYTLDEARALVPRLRALLTAIQTERRELARTATELQRLTPRMRSNGHAAEASALETRMTELATSIRGKLAQIAALDVEVKDIESGLVDFYSLRDGEVVFLCWKVDEPTIAYWHELDAGFRGRQPLDE